MQQFRPLPRFDLLDEEDPRESTIDPVPALTGSRSSADDTSPSASVPRAMITAQIPIVVLSGPHAAGDTGELAALIEKASTTGQHPTVTAALRAAMETSAKTADTTARMVVIPGARKPPKTAKTTRHLNPRLRHVLILLATLVMIVCTLTALVPLSDSSDGRNLFSDLGTWIRSAQIEWDIQAHQSNQSKFPTSLNGPGLPYMAIANSPYVAVAEREASAAGIPPVYFVRQIQQESGFNPKAVSVTNAQGIAQFEPYTAADLGINPWNPEEALRGAARLMASYYHQYGNYAKALGAYNAGPGAVQGAVYSCGMYWLNCMPAQTQDYVYRIMGV